jgi:NAD(P)-dependent dehydrogenase (short-subunit alcohol dehydrogenase family)
MPGARPLSLASRAPSRQRRKRHRHGMASTDVAKGTEHRMGRLTTKIAIVTGAANGIGRAIALRFAAEGAAVVIGDIDGASLTRTAAAISSAGGTAAAVMGDLTEEEGAAALIDTAVDRYGRIDILVNNLGGSRNAKVWEMSVADFDFVLRLNLRSTFLCTRAAAAHMMKRRQGRIICMSSGAREGTPWTAYYQGGAAYSAAKAGVHGFIRDVALELAGYNITVNAVAPGPIDTERAGPNLKRLDATVERSPSRMTPLGRLGTVDEVAAAALFLASDEASYVSGHTLHVAGGR